MIDQAELRLTCINSVEDQTVLLELLHTIGHEAFKPGAGFLVAIGHAQRSDEGLETGVGRCNRDLVFPDRVGQVEDGCRHLVGSELLGVVCDDAGATADSNPCAISGAIVGRHGVDDIVGQCGQEALGGDCTECAGVLSEVHLRGGGVTLLDHLSGEFGRIAVARLDRDSRFLGELSEERADELLTSAGVDDQAVRWFIGRTRGARGAGREDGGRGEDAGGHEGSAAGDAKHECLPRSLG